MAKKHIRNAGHHLTNVELAHRPIPRTQRLWHPPLLPKASAATATKGRKKADYLLARRDISCRAVKTTGHRSQNMQWGVDEDWTTLFKGDVRPDFVVFVWFSDSKNPDVCRIFVVPADIVDAAARESHLHWHKYPRRDGSRRSES